MASAKQIAANRQNAAKSTGPKSAAGKQVSRMNALKHGLQAEHVVIPGEDPEEFEALRRSLEADYQPAGPVEVDLVDRIAYGMWGLRRCNRIETVILCEEHFSKEKHHADYEIRKIEEALEGGYNNQTGEPLDKNLLDRLEAHLTAHCGDLPTKGDVTEREPEDAAGQEELRRLKDARDKAENELQSSKCLPAEIFGSSFWRLEKLSRYRTTIERQLRNAMQDFERQQAKRQAKAAATARVIDVADLNRDQS